MSVDCNDVSCRGELLIHASLALGIFGYGDASCREDGLVASELLFHSTYCHTLSFYWSVPLTPERPFRSLQSCIYAG